MASILLIETATGVCSIGLSRDGQLLALQQAEEPYQHARRITLLIEAVLREAGTELAALDALALSSGPGSYTSLRVGTATAKGIGFAIGTPLLAIDTLQSLALAARYEGDGEKILYAPMIDARRQEVYTALYDGDNRLVSPTAPHILGPDSFSRWREQGYRIVVCGDGTAKCRELLGADHPGFLYREEVQCRAGNLLPLAEKAWQEGAFADLAYYEPNYLKPPNVTRPRPRL